MTVQCFVGFRPILDAMKTFAKDASPIDIEVHIIMYYISFLSRSGYSQ